MSKLTIVVFSLLGLISACVGQSIVQSGQCDPYVPVVTDFRAVDYVDTWYDIESLPSEFQDQGTCNTARYIVSGSGLSITNTQVTADGALSTATGAATFQDPSNTAIAKLNVVIGTTNPTPVPYWVLDTDYENYALVYSCVDLPNNNRRVNSWKLSRTQGPLSPEFNDKINLKIAEVEALSSAATQYIRRDHSAFACSTFVDLAGTCPTPTGDSDFDASEFQGTWYESARFRQASQTGQCNRAKYELGTNGVVTVQNTQVNDERLQTISGVAFALTGQTGVLQVNFDISGGLRSQTLYVLATDNHNYALLYSCQSLGVNSRRVYSWQLRKTLAPLTAPNVTAINNAIAANSDLNANQASYVPTSHSDASCFHYPVWSTLPETIDLPGLCSGASVTGATVFDAEAFVGTWYEVARYPQPTQTGECNRVAFGVGTGGAITIQNSQVFDETLSVIPGQATTVAGQPGVLDVTLTTSTTPLRLYVLATDNTNYALLYNCQDNTETNMRRVSSWKLSKELGALSAEATAAIDAVIAVTQGLDENYYQSTSQSDVSCFHYPEFATLPPTIDLPGLCINASPTGTAAFDAQTFVGTWYEVARYPQPTQTGQCNRAEYGAGTGGVITVRNSQVVDESLRTILGQATPVAGQNGVLEVTLETSSGPTPQRLYVLATDNTNYALLYSCQDITETNMRRVSSWILSKQLGAVNAEANAAIDNVIANTQGLRTNYYQLTSQSNDACFHYPEWETLPATIDLPGPCSSSITGANAFNAQAFVGTWYEVARFPQPTQTGQCNRADYGAGTDGVITVRNSQVVDESLRTILGQATPVAGQNGVLEVTLETSSGPVTRNLVVLATDNTNFALLYSCENIDGNQRRVGSWKLSKQLGPLSAAANAAIDTVVGNTQGLIENYYQSTSQSDEACFYYPEWETLPATIDLPGPCNTSINGASTFTAQTFLGTWYEVARYPQPTQTGQCNRAVYGAGTGGAITIQNSQVNDETLSTIPGQATAVAGQTGVLEVTLTTSSGPVTQNLVVLATDNNNFALLYSCRNIDGNQRRVGSWKLSKQLGPLSAAANATIDNVVASTQGLLENYYQSTSQADEACFHYPAQAGEKVIIPGQCATIPGHTDINMTRFATDIWYHIQRYDAVGNRSCVSTRLRLGEEGNSVTVNSVELVGDEVNRTEGTAQLTSPGNSQFTLTWSGSEDTTTVNIVATNYDEYAIAYTCENSGTENRQVGVWLLSRQRTWPSSGATELTRLVNSRQEFTQRDGYFKPITHNDECPEPSSAFLFKSSIIVIFVCTILQFVW